jgi:signal transduction histidine kinase
LESAINDLFQKISGSGTMNASSRFHDYSDRLKPEKELVVFRIVQELVNNILKHSSSSFIHLTQNVHGDKFYLRIHHDGKGIVQADFDKLNKSNVGLGLKNISSRLRVVQGNIVFEKDISQTYYKVTIELPEDEPYE